jgi:hypothetical protein
MNPYAQQAQAYNEQQASAYAAQQAAADERVKTQQQAAEKAMQLLRENLSEKQKTALDKNGWFLVEGGKSKKTYRIYGNRCAGNIHELCAERKKEIARYCVHAEYSIPLGDQLLAQAICLRLDEEHIISRANKTDLAA